MIIMPMALLVAWRSRNSGRLLRNHVSDRKIAGLISQTNRIREDTLMMRASAGH